MKQSILNIWHFHRARWHWNRMKAIAASQPYSHAVLMDCHAGYYLHSVRYNESIEYLVENANYITANSLIRNSICS